jgi:FkbM family methyltransferase
VGYPTDSLFKQIKNGEEFPDLPIKEELDKYLSPESICVDAGANLGYVSLYMGRKAKRVYAFEPQRVVFMQLCANIFINEQFNVVPYNYGVYSENKRFHFAKIQDGWVGTNQIQDYNLINSIGSISLQPNDLGSMECLRLDEAIEGPVHLMKFDCEGGDIDGIIGSEGILINHRPIIIFEYNQEHSQRNYNKSIDDLLKFTHRFNYKMTQIDAGNYLLK